MPDQTHTDRDEQSRSQPAAERGEDEVFGRQYEVYREAYEQRGLTDEEARQKAAEELDLGEGKLGQTQRDRA